MSHDEHLAAQLARAFALTEIFPLRHPSVQEVLGTYVEAAGSADLSLEIRDGTLHSGGVPVEEDSSDLKDLAKGLLRCGFQRLDVAGGVEVSVLGSFLDALRIAYISGQTENLRELVTYHHGLTADFSSGEQQSSGLTTSAGAIFAAALGGQGEQVVRDGPEPGVGGVDGSEDTSVSMNGGSGVAFDGPSTPEELAAESVQGDGDEGVADSELVAATQGTEWDPPGVDQDPGVRGSAEADSQDTEEVEDPTVEASADGMTVQEFGVGLDLFLQGSEAEQRAWAGALTDQAARLDPSSDPDLVLALLARLLGQSTEASPHIQAVLHALANEGVMESLAARLGSGDADEESQGDALRLAVALGSTAAPALARELARSADRGVRRALMYALSQQGRGSFDSVLSLLEDPHWYVIRNAVTVFGHVGEPGDVSRLEAALGHADARVRKEVVTSLGEIGGSEAEAFLISALDDREADVRASATLALSRLNTAGAASALRDLIRREANEDVLIEACRGLGRLEDGAGVDVIRPLAELSFYSRPSKALRVAAFRALGAIGTAEALAVLEASSEDRDPDIRSAIALALETTGR